MLEASRRRLLESLKDDDVVLDIGGGRRPFHRADLVMDLLPYASRGEEDVEAPSAQRFGPEQWIERDVCDREPYPFADDEIDFVVCSHTLEDVRDPIWVCSEMCRIAKAGYIEVPSRLQEQSVGVHGPWVGWSHHRWLIDVSDGRIEFVMKPHLLQRRGDHFEPGFHASLSAEDKVQTLWWTGGFAYRERVMTGPEELDAYLADFVAEQSPPKQSVRSTVHATRARLRRARSAVSLRGR